MKTLHLITLGLLAGGLTARAQFNSGSTGAYGPLNVTTNTTLPLPADGIFHCTTLTVSTGATLRFTRNEKNTPVYLLATSHVNVQGTIDVSGSDAVGRESGQGGPGGFDGGAGGDGSEVPPGDGHGPGAGKGGLDHQGFCNGVAGSAGAGSYSSAAQGLYNSANKGSTYGSALLVPPTGGSGGGGTAGSPGFGGGGGGGAIVIASSTQISVTGLIRADGSEGFVYGSGCGATYHLTPGSGGAIRLVAPAVAVTGALSATGPTSGAIVHNHGRIRIDSIDHRNSNLNTTPFRSIGTYMVVFPSTLPRLDIIEFAGTNIVEGSGPVMVQLPNNSSTNRTVTVKAQNFFGLVTNLVVLTPENGPRTIYTNIIDNASSNPATNTVTVGLPPNTPVTIESWPKVP